ncbi:hypothetical protein GCM10017687_37410 [Streptomyces echinatus]
MLDTRAVRAVRAAACPCISNQVAGDPMIELVRAGALTQSQPARRPLSSRNFSATPSQICRCGARSPAARLAASEARQRLFDLVSSPSVCEHCSGACCATRTDTGVASHAARSRCERPQSQRGVDLATRGTLRVAGTVTDKEPPGDTPVCASSDGVLEPADHGRSP